MKWSDPFLKPRAKVALWVHRRFFNQRHFWVRSLRPDILTDTWCLECGTVKGYDYKCTTEARIRRRCDRVGDFPNCVEVIEALLFVRHPEVDKAKLCTWCEEQVRGQLAQGR